jgi:hypothetical protein
MPANRDSSESASGDDLPAHRDVHLASVSPLGLVGPSCAKPIRPFISGESQIGSLTGGGKSEHPYMRMGRRSALELPSDVDLRKLAAAHFSSSNLDS